MTFEEWLKTRHAVDFLGGDWPERLMRLAWQQGYIEGRTDEREECAKLCDEDARYWKELLKELKHAGDHTLTANLHTAESLAGAIRARSTKGTE